MTTPAIPPRGYRLVYADPAWRFDTWSAKGEGRSPQAHYRCMDTRDIMALWDGLGLDACVARDCVLALWTTWPHLARGDAHAVVRAWGFRPVTGGAWTKTDGRGEPVVGTGKILRGVTEPFLIATRGSPAFNPGAAPNGGVERVEDLADGWETRGLFARRRRHSEKPESVRDMLERAFRGPGLEMFARKSPRPGWTAWGDQVGLLDNDDKGETA